MNRNFTEEVIQIIINHTERCSIAPCIRGMPEMPAIPFFTQYIAKDVKDIKI